MDQTIDRKGIEYGSPISRAFGGDSDKMLALGVSGIADQTVACLVGVAGLSGINGNAGDFVAVHAAVHGALQQNAFRVLLCGSGGVLISAQNFAAGIIFHDRRHQHGNVCGSAVVVGVVKSAGVGEVGIFQPQLFHLFVHQLDEFVLRAAEINGDRGGSICTGGQCDPVHQIFQGNGFTLFKAGTGSFRFDQRGNDLVSHGKCIVHVFDMFRRH